MKTVLLITQGCDKNTVDTEILAGALAKRGLRPVAPTGWRGQDDPIDAIVVNTCGFIDDAQRQSIETILEWADYAGEQAERPRLIVTGCLSQKYAGDLSQEIPEVDAFFGVGAWDRIAQYLSTGTPAEVSAIPEPDMRIDSRLERLPLDGEPHRFLRISDGCNQTCTFCAIPSMKGRHRSVAPEILEDEARALLGQGTRELNLIAQDLTSYGIDLRDMSLASLIRRLDAIEGEHWIRLFYAYPSRFDEELIDAIAGASHVIPYLDMPLQHASDPVLRAMRRPGSQVDIRRLLGQLRAGIPDLVLRTTFIVGFPGETDEDFQALLDFVEEQRFDRAGAFIYQPQTGTPSATLPHQVPDEVKEERHHALMVAQQRIAEQRQRERFLGREIRVLVEGWSEEAQHWRTRSFADGPEVDGVTWLEGSPDALQVGQFIGVKIIDTDPYDMRAIPT